MIIECDEERWIGVVDKMDESMFAIYSSVLRDTIVTTYANNTKSKSLLIGGKDRANIQIGKASYGSSKTGASISLTGVDKAFYFKFLI